MKSPLASAVLDQAFVAARTHSRFTDQPIDDAMIRRLYDTLKWGPTSLNTQPARYVFVRSAAAKARLRDALSAGNLAKTMAAPLTVIVAWDTSFFEQLPAQFPSFPAGRELFAGNAPLAQATALRNGSLQGAYLIIAARLLGLDAGPMSGFDNAKLDAAFFAGTTWQSNFLVNLGYGDGTGLHPRGPRLAFEEVARVE